MSGGLSPLVAVVIGRAHSGAGVIPLLVEPGGRKSWRGTAVEEVQDWSLLIHGPIPAAPDEMIIRVGRRRRQGEVLTLIGCYRFARFPGNPRDNTYVGACVIAQNARLDAREAVGFVTGVAHRLAGENGLAATSAKDHAHWLEGHPIPVGLLEPGGAGLSPDAVDRLYLDLTPFGDKQVFDQQLNRAVQAAQGDAAFAIGSDLLIGNQDRLKKTAPGYNPIPVDSSGRSLDPSRPAAPKPAPAAPPPQNWMEQPRPFGQYGGGGLSLESLSARMDQLEYRVNAGSQRGVRASVRTGDEPSTPSDRSSGWLIALSCVAVLLLALVAAAVAFWPKISEDPSSQISTRFDRDPPIDPAGVEDATGEQIVENGEQPRISCPMADETDRRAVDEERVCLSQTIADARDRMEDLGEQDERLRSGNGR